MSEGDKPVDKCNILVRSNLGNIYFFVVALPDNVGYTAYNGIKGIYVSLVQVGISPHRWGRKCMRVIKMLQGGSIMTWQDSSATRIGRIVACLGLVLCLAASVQATEW